jgi:hypothetical protein
MRMAVKCRKAGEASGKSGLRHFNFWTYSQIRPPAHCHGAIEFQVGENKYLTD